MKLAADFRSIAREALRGKWLIAVLTGFVASLIGATLASSGGSSYSRNRNSSEGSSLTEHLNAEIVAVIVLVLAVILIISLIQMFVALVIGGAGKLGYAQFNMHLVDGKNAQFTDLFSQIHRLGDGFIMNLLVGIYTFLWSLLFIIPGIVKSYSYAMTPYILSEHPEYNPNYAISLSREMMAGNKFRLFCLRLSFIGWDILCVLPTIIAVAALLTGWLGLLFLPLILLTFVGELFLHPYREAAQAAFYREVSGTELPAAAPAEA